MGNDKKPHKPFTHVNFNYVTLDDIIKASSHKFHFGDIPNGSTKNYLTVKEHNTDDDGDTSMILTRLSKRDKVFTTDIRKVLSIPNQYFKQDMKDLTIYAKLYHQVNT